MHGLGNDYVYVDCTKLNLENAPAVSRFVSDRHFGIGSDGLILIKASEVADFEMDMYNADGSRSQMCGNGIRCVAKYVHDKGLTDKTSISVNTGAGIKYLDLELTNGMVSKVKVDMGGPIIEASKIPANFPKDKLIDEPIVVDGKEYRITGVSMGNPHCVIFIDEDIRELEIEKIGPIFESHSIFPERANIEFVNVLDRSHLRMRVWERGSGETLACGTGACAVAVAGVLNGYSENRVDIELLGGHLDIDYDENADTVYMSGPATFVFDGEIDMESVCIE